MLGLTKRDAAGSLQHFDSAVRVYPGYYEVYYLEAIAQLQLRNNEEALRCFQKAIDLSEGRYAGAQFGYGLALLREGEAEEAECVVATAWKQIRTVWMAMWFWSSCC